MVEGNSYPCLVRVEPSFGKLTHCWARGIAKTEWGNGEGKEGNEMELRAQESLCPEMVALG